MAYVKHFSDSDLWKTAREVCSEVHQLKVTSDLKSDYGLWDQINRSSGSIMDNIAEGFERGGNREFIQFISYAKGSVGETISQLYRCLDRAYILQEKFDPLLEKLLKLGSNIGGFIHYLKQNHRKGPKWD